MGGQVVAIDDYLSNQLNGQTRLEFIANLIFKNGGRSRVTSWGIHSNGFGLTQEEALILIGFEGFLNGIAVMDRSAEQYLIERISKVVDAKIKEFDSQ